MQIRRAGSNDGDGAALGQQKHAGSTRARGERTTRERRGKAMGREDEQSLPLGSGRRRGLAGVVDVDRVPFTSRYSSSKS